MTSDQVGMLVRFFGTLIGGILISRGLIDKTSFASWLDQVIVAIPAISAAVAVLIPLVTGAWSMLRHTAAGNVMAAAAVEGAKVVVDPVAASPYITALARDPTVPGVEFQKP